MNFDDSFLPETGWTLDKATMASGLLSIQAGGSASVVITGVSGTNVLPEVLLLLVKAQTYANAYAPTSFVHLHILYIDNSAYDALVPIVDVNAGCSALLYPTSTSYDDKVEVDAFTSITFTITSSTGIELTEWSLSKTLGEVLVTDKLYYGIKITTSSGFEATRSDKKARAYFNADNLAMQTGDGTGETWVNKLYYKYEESTGLSELVFDGALSATLVSALSALISPNLYAGKATIAEVTVDELDTSNSVQKYLVGDTSADNFQYIYDQYQEFITATTDGSAENKVHATNRDGGLLYWIDDKHEAASTTVTAFPVYTYMYNKVTKMKFGFGDDPSGSGYQVPMLEIGAGTGVDNNAKGFIYKGVSGLYIDYYSTTGELRRVLLSDDGIVLTPYALKSLDFYANGFQAAYDGDTVSMTWTLDAQGIITALITPDNVTIPVTWHGGDL